MTSPCFLRWFMSNAPVFGHRVLSFGGERRGEERESEYVGERSEESRLKRTARLEATRRPNKPVVGSYPPI